jgi:hypothetical protein
LDSVIGRAISVMNLLWIIALLFLKQKSDFRNLSLQNTFLRLFQTS